MRNSLTRTNGFITLALGIIICPALAHADNPILPLQWSYAGPLPNQVCLQINEPGDPDTWDDNYLCSSMDQGLAWSYAGAIPGLHCVSFNEPVDNGWWDNYLCSVDDLGMQWSSAGPVPGKSCLQINEPADPHTWNDNYLCFAYRTVMAVALPATAYEWTFLPAPGDNTPHYMESSVRISDDIDHDGDGTVEISTHIWSHSWFRGFSGAVQVFLYDSVGNLLWYSDKRVYGVSGTAGFQSERLINDIQEAPIDLLRRSARISIMHGYESVSKLPGWIDWALERVKDLAGAF